MPLTPAEIRVCELLAEAHNAFTALPERMTSDVDEWAAGVHALQQRVMARAAVRDHPETFAPLVGALGSTLLAAGVDFDEPAGDAPPLGYVGDGLPPGWRAVANEHEIAVPRVEISVDAGGAPLDRNDLAAMYGDVEP